MTIVTPGIVPASVPFASGPPARHDTPLAPAAETPPTEPSA